MTYSEKLKDPRWQKKRLQILERDNFTCRYCEDTEKTLHVHHMIYSKAPWLTDNEHLLTLCEDCHKEIEGEIDASKHFLSHIINQDTGKFINAVDVLRSISAREIPEEGFYMISRILNRFYDSDWVKLEDFLTSIKK